MSSVASVAPPRGPRSVMSAKVSGKGSVAAAVATAYETVRVDVLASLTAAHAAFDGRAVPEALAHLEAARVAVQNTGSVGDIYAMREETGRNAMALTHEIAARLGWDLACVEPGPTFAKCAIHDGHGDVARTWAALMATCEALLAAHTLLTQHGNGFCGAIVKQRRASAEAFAAVARS